tara:strand:+ start:3454 stop:4179 length:726 start_codon:yes stop_codon:yes gene_type:complete
MNNDLELLKDDEQYYRGVGKKYLSNSDISSLLKNPKNFKVEQPDNINFMKGRLFHQLILEPQKAEKIDSIDVNSRNTKAYKEYSNGNIVLLKKEVDDITSLTKTMLGNLDFYDMIKEEDNKYEVPAIKEIYGVKWKGKADIVNKHVLIDLKTTSDINKFKWSAKEYNYDSQAFIYQQLFGKPLIFLVIDKLTQALGMFEPTQEFIERGERKVELAVEVYNNFFGDNPKEDINTYYINEQLN